MELIRISNRKLKIMLTPTDMCHFKFNTDSFGEDSAQMHRAFRLLLEEVRKQTDFEADDNHLSIQYFPSREGGCEMFISHLQADKSEPTPKESAELLPITRSSVQLCPSKKQIDKFKKDVAYRFECLPHLLKTCKRLLGVRCVCESTAYRDENGTYFLILTVLSPTPFAIPEELDFIIEYGAIENPAFLRLYIREHAISICSENAIGQLAELA